MIKLKSPIYALIFFLFLSGTALASSPTLVNVGVSAEGNQITMSAQMTDGFPEEVLEAVESGVPMTYIFHVELRKNSSLWVDSLVSENIIEHTVHYDSLKKVYRFTEKGKNIRRKLMTRKRDRYQQMMASLASVPIAPIYKLNPDDKYYIRVKADLQIDRFWFPFNYILFFVPLNDMETDWTKSSLLSIEPNLSGQRQEAFQPKANDKKAGNSKALKHVIRTFNR